MRLRTGRPSGPAVSEPESAEAAYAEAVKRLARQPQSRAMLRQRLLHAGYAEAAVSPALDRAERHGYLNDRAFADALVRRRTTSRGRGLIAQELRARGIEDVDAEPALAEVDPDAQLSRALILGRSLLGRREFNDGEALLNFLAPRLARRGFSSGLAYRVCRTLTTEWEAAHLFDSKKEHN